MHHYLNQLHADIAAAKQHPPQRPAHLPKPKDEFEAHIEEVEAFLHGPMHDFAYWTGIEWEALPPPEMIPSEEMERLGQALVDLWEAYNVFPAFPEEMPWTERYRAIRDSWKNETTMVHESSLGGRITYDFCTGYAPDCVLKEYCSCRDMWADETEENVTD